MTKHELNKAIAEAFGLTVKEWKGDIYVINADGTHTDVDYLNNWNDLMPLVFEHDVFASLAYEEYDCEDKMYSAKHKPIICNTVNFDKKAVYNKSPQRALAECLLKVLKEKENEVD